MDFELPEEARMLQIGDATQTFGAMGIAKKMPLHLMHQQLRAYRIFQGPTEVRRSVVARRLIRDAPD